MKDVYQTVTNTIVEMLESSVSDESWKRPWSSLAGSGHSWMPYNANSKRHYRGINVPLLLMTASAKGYVSNEWATFKGWKKLGAKVSKGEKATHIVFWKKTSRVVTNNDGEEETKSGLIARGYCVFNANQVENYEPKAPKASEELSEPERIQRAEDCVNDYIERENISVQYGGDRAFYAPSFDIIQMPIRKAFKTKEDFYATLLHECTHSTGAKHRLNREFGKRFGDGAYAMEELVAELGAAMQCSVLGVNDHPREDHAKYLKHWIKVLKEDKRAIFTVSSKAQAASDYIIGKQELETEEDEAERAAA